MPLKRGFLMRNNEVKKKSLFTEISRDQKGGK